MATQEAPPELRPLGALLLVLIHFAALMSGYVLAAAMSHEDRISMLNLIAAAVVGPLMALYVGLNRHAPSEPTARALRLGLPRGRQIASFLAAGVAGAAVAPLAGFVTEQILAFWPNAPLPEELRDATDDVAPGLVAFLLVRVGQVLGGPLAEEMLFRGFLQPRLGRSIGGLRAFLVTLALYAAAQINPRYMLAALLVGIPAGIAAWRSGNTWPAVSAHVGHQVVGLALSMGIVSVSSPLLAACGAAAALALAATWFVGGAPEEAA